MIKSNLDPETKVELLIKLAFGISIEDLSKEYHIAKNKIVNLRKNNYKLYNKFFDHWKIDKNIAILGLTPIHERALNVVKKFYKEKLEIITMFDIRLKGEKLSFTDIINEADKILQKDNITSFKQLTFIKNYY